MDIVYCEEDELEYTADNFEKLTDNEIANKRGSLYCISCKAKAWFSKSTHTLKLKRKAYFNSHHSINGCDLKTSYLLIEDERDKAPETTELVNEVDEFIVNLDGTNSGTNIYTSANEDEIKKNFVEPVGGRNVKGLGEKRKFDQQKSLRQILYSLVKHPRFKSSDKKIVFYSEAGAFKVNGIVKNVTVNFEHFKPTEKRENLVYWGQIVDAKYWNDSILLNSGHPVKDVSVKIFKDVIQDFISDFKIKSLDELNGAYIIIVGKGSYTSNGKPIIYCSSSSFINIQRYKLID